MWTSIVQTKIHHFISNWQINNENTNSILCGGYKMNFKDFIEMYDNWNGVTRVNDNDLDMIVEDRTNIIMDNRKDLYDKEVVAFGFYDGLMTVRVK